MTHPSPTASTASSDDEGENGILDWVTEEEAEGENQEDVMDCNEGLIEFATQAGEGENNTISWCGIKWQQ